MAYLRGKRNMKNVRVYVGGKQGVRVYQTTHGPIYEVPLYVANDLVRDDERVVTGTALAQRTYIDDEGKTKHTAGVLYRDEDFRKMAKAMGFGDPRTLEFQEELKHGFRNRGFNAALVPVKYDAGETNKPLSGLIVDGDRPITALDEPFDYDRHIEETNRMLAIERDRKRREKMALQKELNVDVEIV